MPGFVAVLAAFAVLSAGLSSVAVEEGSIAGVKSSAVPALNHSAVAHVGTSADGDKRTGQAGCPGRCRCEVDGLLHRVDCSDLGLLEIPSNLSIFTSYLDLSMNNLTVLSGVGLSSLHFLEELRLAGNDLSLIPRGAFAGLYNLKVLMLQNNQLRSVPAEAFNNLHNLQSLRLDANHISTVPVGCFSGMRSLRHLWLDDNSLTEVPVEALSELPTLQAMTLALNHISHVPDYAFSKLGRLVVLHLNNNRIVSMGTNCFHGLRSLETLDLNYNSLVEFPTAIRSLSHLKELGFHSNNIQSIPEHAFTGNPSLITIFFYNNPIQSVGSSAFQNLPELRTLSLNGAADLTEFPDLTGTKSLESLTITGARITSLPSSVCEQLPNLQLLDLSYNQIQTLPSFSGCENIQKIDLHNNDLEQLQENTFHGLMSLRSVDLSWNRLSSVKLNSFSALPALTKLDLSSNQLSSLPLTGLQTLTHLRLAGNNQLMELIPREDLPRIRVMELPYAFQCCAFVSCEREGGGSLSWEKEEAADSTGRHPTDLSSPADQDWDDFLLELDDEPKPQHSVHCSPAPGPFRPCRHLLGSWLIRGSVWLIAAFSLVSNSLVVLSVFFSPTSSVTPPKLLIGLLALVNGLMGVWSGWLAAVDAWTFGSFWRSLLVFPLRPSFHLSVFPLGFGRHAAPPADWTHQHLPLFASAFLLFFILLGFLRLPGSPRLAVFPPHDTRLHSPLLSSKQSPTCLRGGGGADPTCSLAALLRLPPLPPSGLPLLLLPAAPPHRRARGGKGSSAACGATAGLRQPAALPPVQPARQGAAGGTLQTHLWSCSATKAPQRKRRRRRRRRSWRKVEAEPTGFNIR
ncbi:leucine-rich repeat-containing G-protein coupled receptor 5-like isoform X4 [Channa argus]|uniref:leucine-rich repeat-containing G-protein coupled receptor 5-like isoform X4 n=1 Tax=Channa argus TaxID=215402 RepID=UPI00352247BF